jgi:hypothetical protein
LHSNRRAWYPLCTPIEGAKAWTRRAKGIPSRAGQYWG